MVGYTVIGHLDLQISISSMNYIYVCIYIYYISILFIYFVYAATIYHYVIRHDPKLPSFEDKLHLSDPYESSTRRSSSSGTLTYEPAAPGTDGETVRPMLQIAVCMSTPTIFHTSSPPFLIMWQGLLF